MEAPTWFVVWFAPIGAIYMGMLCYRFVVYLALCLRQSKDLRRCYGSWAVITGPTSGLGRCMAIELARTGLNLVLVGRDPAKLGNLSDSIAKVHGVETKTVVFDLSLVSTAQGDEAMRRLRETMEELDVGVLVNNAGVAKPGAMFLHEADVEPLMRIVRVNLLALTEVTAAVLPGMVARGRGVVVNIGSGSSALAIPSFPLYSVYGATKRYVAAFSRSLYAEYKSKGIDVQCQAPLLMDTNMVSTAIRGSFLPAFLVTPTACARAAVRLIGHGGPLCVPNVAHQFQWWISGFVPDFLLDAYRLAQHLQQRAVFSFLRERSPAGRGKQVKENGLTSY